MQYCAAILFLCLALLMPAMVFGIDLANPQDYLNAFMRVRGDAEGGETLYFWTGSVYSIVPGEKRVELFGFEGYNLAKTVPGETGFQLLTREAAFFTDYRSGEILEKWRNPFTEKEVPVVQIWNDPVNQDLEFGSEMVPYAHQILPSTDLGDQLVFHMDIFPFYPSPLPRKEFGEFSQNDTYQAAEFFQFFTNKSDLLNPALKTVPVSITWNRISPWMPFMRMGDRPGNLVFVCRGQKLKGSFEALPKKIKDYVMANKPEFSSPPSEWSEPNETSWTYFRKLIEQGIIKQDE
ncbi:MAG: DUF1838 family protein [Candidatus Cloacimonetes bacterium]|nr:DUF1838 family protein [Candidatus Cloacimonadota bacterium]